MINNDQIGELIEITEKVQGCANYLQGSWFELQRMARTFEGLGPTLQEAVDKMRELVILLQEEKEKYEDDLK